MPLRSLLALAVIGYSSLTFAQKTPSDYLGETWLHHLYGPFMQQLSQMPNLQGSSPEDRRNCDQFYAGVRAKGQMRIIMGIGYYDSSEGGTYSFSYYPDGQRQLVTHDFGMNSTMDIALESMYRKILTAPCKGNLQLCGFREVQRGVYSKAVRDPNGGTVNAVIEIRDSSVTTEHSQNVGTYLAQQQAKSEATTQWFFGSIPTADFVIYNGHSRKGGGPDFHPPQLRPNLHVNYSYYEKKTPGLKRLLSALSSSSQTKAMWMMSCNSKPLFAASIQRSAPQAAFSGTNAVIPGDIPNKGAIAGMDSFLRFQCQDGFNQAMHAQESLRLQLSLPSIR